MEVIAEGARGLREHRLAKGLTQSELARLAQTDMVTISRYEHGKVIPSGPSLQRLASALGVSASDILLGERRRAS